MKIIFFIIIGIVVDIDIDITQVAEFTTAMEAEISDRLASPQASTATVGQALVVIRVGTDSFKQVYESIGEMIIKQESAGMQLYSQAVDKLNALADQHSKKKPAQRKAVNTDAVQLMTDAVMTKSSFDSVVDDIVNECKKMGFNVYTKVGDIKNLDRYVRTHRQKTAIASKVLHH